MLATRSWQKVQITILSLALPRYGYVESIIAVPKARDTWHTASRDDQQLASFRLSLAMVAKTFSRFLAALIHRGSRLTKLLLFQPLSGSRVFSRNPARINRSISSMWRWLKAHNVSHAQEATNHSGSRKIASLGGDSMSRWIVFPAQSLVKPQCGHTNRRGANRISTAGSRLTIRAHRWQPGQTTRNSSINEKIVSPGSVNRFESSIVRPDELHTGSLLSNQRGRGLFQDIDGALNLRQVSPKPQHGQTQGKEPIDGG